MTEHTALSSSPAPPAPRFGLAAGVLGGVLLLPAVVVLAISYIAPTVATVRSSLRDASGNYSTVLDAGYAETFGFTVYLASFRHRERTRPGAATVVVGALAVISTLAAGQQLYAYPAV